jgi:hypothetical protein
MDLLVIGARLPTRIAGARLRTAAGDAGGISERSSAMVGPTAQVREFATLKKSASEKLRTSPVNGVSAP